MTRTPPIQTIEAISDGESALDVTRRIAEASALPAADTEVSEELRESSLALHQAILRVTLTQRLHKAMEDAAARDAASMEALRMAVCEFTIVLREEGATPEATLILLKSTVNRKALPQLTAYGRDHQYLVYRSLFQAGLDMYIAS
jgi:negative regulator of replication initiation